MVAMKSSQARSFAKSVPTKLTAFLFHGGDPGLVSELARQTAETIAARTTPPGEILRIEDADLEHDSDRLAVELETLPMFGGGKVIRTTTGRRINGPMLAGLIADGAPAAALIVEAGNLKATDAVRKAFEKANFAAAVACYGDDSETLEQLAQTMLRDARISASDEVLTSLATRLGADRGLSRQEIEKLIVYMGPGSTLTVEDIDAIVGDAADQALDRLAMAVAEGRGSVALIENDRAISSGQSPQSVLLALQRHFLQLSRLAALIGAGRSAQDAMRQFRPPLHFKTQNALVAQSRIWDQPVLASANQRIMIALKMSRVGAMPEELIVERVLLELATQAKSLMQRRSGQQR